jgi:hypothetical protein
MHNLCVSVYRERRGSLTRVLQPLSVERGCRRSHGCRPAVLDTRCAPKNSTDDNKRVSKCLLHCCHTVASAPAPAPVCISNIEICSIFSRLSPKMPRFPPPARLRPLPPPKHSRASKQRAKSWHERADVEPAARPLTRTTGLQIEKRWRWQQEHMRHLRQEVRELQWWWWRFK